MVFSIPFRALSAGKKAAMLAVFTALSVVVNCFSLDVGASNKIAFTYTVCFFAGQMLGALPAFCVAFAGDAIGYLLNPVGVYWLYGLSLGVYAAIVGAVLNVPFGKGRAAPYVKAACALVLGFVAVTVLLNSAVNYLYLKTFVWQAEGGKAFLVYLGGRLAFQSVVYAVNAAICMLLLPFGVRLSAKCSAKRGGGR